MNSAYVLKIAVKFAIWSQRPKVLESLTTAIPVIDSLVLVMPFLSRDNIADQRSATHSLVNIFEKAEVMRLMIRDNPIYQHSTNS